MKTKNAYSYPDSFCSGENWCAGGAGERGGVRTRAFTLLELLTVIAIIGILAAITVPNLHQFKPNVMAAASRQLLDDVGRARQLAIAHRTTVYMIFVPTNFWADAGFNNGQGFTGGPWMSSVEGREALTNGQRLLDKQLIGYNYVSLRSLGDQPGAPTVKYLSEWRTLPAGSLIAFPKFFPRTAKSLPVINIYTNFTVTPPALGYEVYGFSYTNNIPFPTPKAPPSNTQSPTWAWLPYIAFNYQGQLVSGQNEYIPLALGSIGYARDGTTKEALPDSPSVVEAPPGNSTNSYNLVSIEWLTGRSRIERQEAQ